MNTTLLEMRIITKTFPGVKALSDVSFAWQQGRSTAWSGRTARASRPS